MKAEVLAGLRRLGLAPEDVNALYLIPAAVVAWADGHADLKELEAIAENHRCDCDEGDCVCLSESARQYVYYNYAYRKPDADTLRQALSCLEAHLFTLPQAKANRLRKFMFEIALDVARTSRSGLLRNIGIAEKMAIANVAGALGFHDVEAIEALIERNA